MVAWLAKSLLSPYSFICLRLFFPHPFFSHPKHLHSVCFNKETSSAFFIFLAKTQVKTSSTASSPGGVCVKQKLPDPENQMLSHQTKSAAPAVPETSCW